MALFGNKKPAATPVAPVKKKAAVAPTKKTPVKKAAVAPTKKTPVKKAAVADGEKRVTKVELLRNLFKKVGKKLPVEDVLEETGYDLRNLRTTCGILRNEKRTKEENLMDLRFSDGIVQRVE